MKSKTLVPLALALPALALSQVFHGPFPLVDGQEPPVPLKVVHMTMRPDGSIIAFGYGQSPGLFGGQSRASYSPDATLLIPPDGGWREVSSSAPALKRTGLGLNPSTLGDDSTSTNLFCAGHIQLDDAAGTLLFAGGDRNVDSTPYHGIAQQVLLSSAGGEAPAWQAITPMARARWYPSLVNLPNGRVLITAGSGGAGNPAGEDTPETMAKGLEMTSVWPGGHYTSYLPWGGSVNGVWNYEKSSPHNIFYPFLWPMTGGGNPDGVIYSASQNGEGRVYNPLTNEFSFQRIPDTFFTAFRTAASAILMVYNNEQTFDVVATGGSYNTVQTVQTGSRILWGERPAGAPATGTWINGPHPWMPNMKAKRKNHFMLALPNFTLMVVGGNESGFTGYNPPFAEPFNARYRLQRSPEIWNPLEPYQQWQPQGAKLVDGILQADPESPASSKVCRGYHLTSMLLPCGRVLIAGADNIEDDDFPGQIRQNSFEIFEPPYYSDPNLQDRPILDGVPKTLYFGEEIGGTITSEPNNKAMIGAVLISLPSATHGWNFGQRIVELRPNNPAKTTYIAPGNPTVAPPGWYMLFGRDEEGAVSHGQIVRLTDRWSRRPVEGTFTIEGGIMDPAATPGQDLQEQVRNALIHGDAYLAEGTRHGSVRLVRGANTGDIRFEFDAIMPPTVQLNDWAQNGIRVRAEWHASAAGLTTEWGIVVGKRTEEKLRVLGSSNPTVGLGSPKLDQVVLAPVKPPALRIGQTQDPHRVRMSLTIKNVPANGWIEIDELQIGGWQSSAE